MYDVGGDSEVVCPQLHLLTGELQGEEDCLMLNLYTPARIPQVGRVIIIPAIARQAEQQAS